VILPRLEWLLPEPLPDPPAFTGFGRPVATLLARRGFVTDTQLTAFLSAGREAFHDVRLMADAEVALTRIGQALAAGERIGIWGDFDADGMTAVAVWTRALGRAGADVLRFIPDRLSDGYGLSIDGLTRLAGLGVGLVITCDCGVSNVREVEAANQLGLEVIITDHHLPADRLPPALAVVDPRRADCPYPDADLTGAGISYKLASALLAERGLPDDGLLPLAAIGTIADLAPMTGESRLIVRLGLAEMARGASAGLRALVARSVTDPERLTVRDLAFGLSPRLNAAGRLADAELAIELLLEDDPERAEQQAGELDAINVRRREVTATAVEEARAMVGEPGERPLALRNDGWAPGIVGLVAGRLADELARPVAVATLVGGGLRGSVRAPRDFHVAAALEACGTLLTKRGGHAAAGGFSLAADQWGAFVERFSTLPRPYPADAAASLEVPGQASVDLVLTDAYLGWGLADELARLEPFGPGHLAPVLAITGLTVGDARRVGPEGRHLALRMRRGMEVFDAIAFGAGPERLLPEPGEPLDLVGTLERDLFEGQPRLRIRLIDWASAALSPIRARGGAARELQPLPVAEGAAIA